MGVPWARSRARVLAPGVIVAVLVIVSLVWVVAGVRSAPARPDRKLVVATGEWAPYVGPDLADGGPVAEIVVSALAAEGYDAELRWTSWPSALGAAQRGAVAATFPFAGTESQRKDFIASDPILDFDYVLFVRREAGQLPDIETADDVASLRVGLIAGYDYWPTLTDALDEVTRYETSGDAFRALARGDVDAVPEGRRPGLSLLSSGELDVDRNDIGFLSPPEDSPAPSVLGTTASLSLLMPKLAGSDEVMADFNRGLAQVRATDAYHAAVAALEGAPAVEVRLTAEARHDGVPLALGNGRWMMAPPGTTARVLRWPAAYTRGTRSPERASVWLPVKVLTGPAAGRVARVRVRHVEVLSTP